MMGDEHIDEEAFGEELRAAVRRLDRVGPPDDDVRARAAARMRDAYATHVPGTEGPGSHANSELVTLVDDQPSPRWNPERIALAAAAVVVVLTAGLVWLTGSRGEPAPTDDPPATSVPVEVPQALGTGSFTTDVLGPRLTFATDETLWLLRAERGVIELGSGPPDEDPSTLAIVRPQRLDPELGVDTLDALFGSFTGPQEQPTRIDGRAANSWRLVSPSSTELCTGDACRLFDAPPVTIRPDRPVDVFEVPLGDGSTAVLVATSDPEQFSFDVGAPFLDILDSIEIDDTAGPLTPPEVPAVEPVADPSG